jgi:F420H(2)-dependent quinone reductase
MNAFNRKLIEEFRANRGQLGGPVAGSQLLLLTTTGARSGKERTTVIGLFFPVPRLRGRVGRGH